MLEAEKRGPALRAAEIYKRLLNRESLRADNGVKFFRDTSRQHFIKGAQSVFLWRFYLVIRAKGGNIEMVNWIGKFSLLLNHLKDFMDGLVTVVRQYSRTKRESVPG